MPHLHSAPQRAPGEVAFVAEDGSEGQCNTGPAAAKNSPSTGARTLAATSCLWPASVRCSAWGRALASARVPLCIHSGLLPPSRTSVGAVTSDQIDVGS